MMLGRFRESLASTQERVHVHAWQLEQLLPEAPAAAATEPTVVDKPLSEADVAAMAASS